MVVLKCPAALLLLVVQAASAAVTLTLNGAAAKVGNYSMSTVNSVVFDNGNVRFTFGPGSGTILLTSALVAGVEIAHNLTGESFYIDAAGNGALVCTTVEVRRVSPDLVEAVFHDTTSRPLQHSHHLIMTSTTDGLYGYDVMTAVADTGISEVRFNVRWDRCTLNHGYNYERGHDSQQPTYAYLYTQDKIQDETWRVDGVNNPSLP